MKLDRNLNEDGMGKYALILLRDADIEDNGVEITVDKASVDFGSTPDTEFFVIRLKDKYACAALSAYAEAAVNDDVEWSSEVFKLALKAANHPSKKKPD